MKEPPKNEYNAPSINIPPDAFYDMFFLLTRGYPRSEALELVKRRYRLSRHEAILLGRCVHPERVSSAIKGKLLALDSVEGLDLVIDGFNQLTTIYAALIGAPVFVCSDGLTRDALLAGPRLVIENIGRLASILVDVIDRIRPRSMVIVFDSQPSHSGMAASVLRSRLKGYRVVVEVSKTADRRVVEYASMGYTVASSDIAIVMNVDSVFDLAAFTIREIIAQGTKVNNIPQLLGGLHTRWCEGRREKGP